MTEQKWVDALKVLTSIIARCERTLPKFVPGTSQHTLLKNRIQALKIGSPQHWSLWPPSFANAKKPGQSTSRAAGNITAMATQFEQ